MTLIERDEHQIRLFFFSQSRLSSCSLMGSFDLLTTSLLVFRQVDLIEHVLLITTGWSLGGVASSINLHLTYALTT